MGDSLGAGIVYHLSKHELPPLPHDDANELVEVATEDPGQRKEPNGAEETETAGV